MNPTASSSGVVCAFPTTKAPSRSTTKVSVIVPPASIASTRGSRPFTCFSLATACLSGSAGLYPAPAHGAPGPARLEAQRELGVLAHQVRRPRRREHHLRMHLRDALELAHVLPHLVRDLGADRAARRGQRER